jgi:hypothetical protein
MTLAAGHFTEACKAASDNLKVPLDLIAIHHQKYVRSRARRAALNSFIALAAAAAWERFLADIVGAARNTAQKPWLGTGHTDLDKLAGNLKPQWVPGDLNAFLRRNSVIAGQADLTDSWEAWLQDPSRTEPVQKTSYWEYATYSRSPSRFEDALKNAQHMRNGAAHFALPQSAVRSVPYGYAWQGDAKSDTIQHWAALPVAALFLQLIDCSIVAIANDRGWSPKKYQPTFHWFAAVVPDSNRRYPGVEFWGGRDLFRQP